MIIPPNKMYLSANDRFSMSLITVVDNPNVLAASNNLERAPLNKFRCSRKLLNTVPPVLNISSTFRWNPDNLLFSFS